MDNAYELVSDSKSDTTVVDSDIALSITASCDVDEANILKNTTDTNAKKTTTFTLLPSPPQGHFNMDNVLDDAERLTKAIHDAITDIYTATLSLANKYPKLTKHCPREAASRVVAILEHFAEIITALPAEGRAETALLLVTHVLECYRVWANCHAHYGYEQIEHGRTIYVSLTEKCRAKAFQKIFDADYPFPGQAAAINTETVGFHLKSCTELGGWPFQIIELIKMWVRINSGLLPLFVRFCTDTPQYSHHFHSLAHIQVRYADIVLNEIDLGRCKKEDGKASGKAVSRKKTWKIWS